MNAGGRTHSAVGASSPADLSRVGGLLAAAVLATLFSIFVAQILAAAAIALWVGECVRRRRIVGTAPRSCWALAAFVGWSLVAVAASSDPAASAIYLKKHLRLLVLPLATSCLTLRLIRLWTPAFFALIAASAFFGILQYAWLRQVDLLHRIDGFMSHWMTFSGQLMVAGLLATALLLFGGLLRAQKMVLSGVAALLAVALVLTMTRSALAGAAVGVLVLAQLRFGWRAGAAVAVALLAVVLLLPAAFQQRIESSFDLSDTTTRGRVDLARTGLRMVQAHPWTGVGPRLVPRAAQQFRVEHEAPASLYQHLHNNALEIAASLGLPALFFWGLWWCWLLAELARGPWRSREPARRALAAAAIAIVVAFQLAGLFEYNFGDAEVVMLVLFAVALPMARE